MPGQSLELLHDSQVDVQSCALEEGQLGAQIAIHLLFCQAQEVKEQLPQPV